jgi:hypothetical protein
MGLITQRSTPTQKTATIEGRTIDALVEDVRELNEVLIDSIWTVDLMDLQTIDLYAPYDLIISSVENVKNAPTTTLEDDDVAYVLGQTILKGSKITVTVSTASVVNLITTLP